MTFWHKEFITESLGAGYKNPLPTGRGERRFMRGNKSRISSLTGGHEYNNDFDRLMSDADHGRLKLKNMSRKDFDRPAYYGTSLSPSGSSQYNGRPLSAESAKRDH